jgi:hypothetical protein
MREFGGIVAALWIGACATQAPPAGQPAPAQRSEVESGIVLAPSEPTPAFVPAHEGACPRDYRSVEGSCVHHAYVAPDDAALQRALAAYKRGAVPPMLGPPQPKAAATAPTGKPALDPGALAKRSGDAGVGRGRRLAELDAMIAVAKEKLRERDERSKARRVEGQPQPAAPGAVTSPAPPLVPATAAAGAAPGADPTQARLSELSQLASQLPPEQLQAITAELSKAGMDMRELEQLLSSARTGDAPH